MKNILKIHSATTKLYNESKMASTSENRSLHGSLKWVLFVAQCFGQMPVLGITAKDSRSLKFSWKSWKTLYCILNCTGSGFISGLFIYRIVRFGATLFEISSLAFYLINFVVTIHMLKLATVWPELMHKWSSVEFLMRSYGWPQNLHTRITIISIVVLTVATVETTSVKISKLHQSIELTNVGDDIAEHYFKEYLFPSTFQILDYALWKAVLLCFWNLLLTFAWSFNDLIIILISTALALRFKQITRRLKLLKADSLVDAVSIWRELREDYNRLATLTRDIDKAFSDLILISFANNLFFILFQLFYSMLKMEDTLERIYFFFSFGFLIFRTIGVTLYGAWIHDESKKPLAILNSVPSNIYNIEIKRFIEQIKFDTVALSGKKIFFITRGLIISMAGAVVTYELVLIQFNGEILRPQ